MAAQLKYVRKVFKCSRERLYLAAAINLMDSPNRIYGIRPEYLLLAVMIFLIFALRDGQKAIEPGPEGSAHIHADFKVYMDGKGIDFSKRQYDQRNPYIHMHMDSPYGHNVLHIEASDVPIGIFFESIGMELSKKCFASSLWERYCQTPQKRLRMFVNGVENSEFDAYVPKDLDRILITWGSGKEDIAVQMATVTDYACLFSRKCQGKSADAIISFEKI